MLLYQLLDGLVGDDAGAFCVDGDVDRACHTDGVGHLDLTLTRQPGCHHVLGDVARCVGCRTVDLGRILAAEGATAMRAGSAIGVDDDLAPRQAAVPLWAPYDKAAGRVDQVLGVDEPFRRDDGLDDLLDDGFVEFGLHPVAHTHVRMVLAGDDDGLDAVGLAVDIAHGDLCLGIGAQEGQCTTLAQGGLPLHQPVGIVDGRRHEFRSFVAGIAEHEALVARADVEVVVAGSVHALGNVVALLVIAHEHGAALVIDAVVGVVVADVLDGVARHLNVVHGGIGGDFACQHHETGVAEGFGRDPAVGILRETGIEDGVGNLVSHLVGVTFGDRFGREEKVVRHERTPKNGTG